MANANIARGLQPVRYRSGAAYNGAGNVYYVPSTYGTALFIGDPVIHTTAAGDANGVPTIIRASAAGGAYILGSIVSILNYGQPSIDITRDKPIYVPASTGAYVLVADDPDLLFEVQEDSVGGDMGLAGGRNVDLIAGNGSTVTGYSGWMLDSSTLQTTATLQMRVYRPADRPDNAYGATAVDYTKWLCSINLHSIRNTTGV